MNRILSEDIEDIVLRVRGLYDDFRDKTVLITGATGLIGSLIVRSLCKMEEKEGLGLRVIALVRNKAKAEQLLNGLKVEIVDNEGDVDGEVDYIVHCAAPTQSRFFVEQPVETLDAIIAGTQKMLEFARKRQTRRFLYLSSMEAYGTINEPRTITEKDEGYIALDSARSSYSLGKRAAELYTYCYDDEYGLNVSIARLAMCFGAGLGKDDHRVHKSFCEDALAGRDIVVKSTGETTVNFVYSADAIVALLMLLVRGGEKKTYNVAGNNNNMTIYNMAECIAGFGGVKVRKELPQGESMFAPDNKMTLDAGKMKSLGWVPKYDLKKALQRLMDYLKNEQTER